MYCGLKTCSDCVKRSRNRDTVKAHEVTISVSIAQAVDPRKYISQLSTSYTASTVSAVCMRVIPLNA